MKKPLRMIIGILIVYFAFGALIGCYEYLNGGPWYTYVNFQGQRMMLGKETTVSAGYNDLDSELPAIFRVIDSTFYPVFNFTRNLY